ncbi:MAG: class I SAM-dependent methyltransferase [Myxococcales bacterium]|nr:class I SAM-dependent methyltransferase [Myxococcales bacterium]
MTRRDRELDAGSLAHYEDPAYYTATYARRLEDVAFYVSLAARARGPVLEYGVGNGRIALPIARHGARVVGVDHSGPMLDDLRARLRDEPADVAARVRLVRGDMRRVRVEGRFALVLCPFNAALHLYERRDVERFLARVQAHLAPGGRFVMDLSMPLPRDLTREPSRPFHAPRFRHPSTGTVVKNREVFDYDPVRQILFVSMEFEPVAAPERSWVVPLAHRVYFPQEWAALLHYNGFDVKRVEGDFQGGPLTRASDVMVWHTTARRAPTRARR